MFSLILLTFSIGILISDSSAQIDPNKPVFNNQVKNVETSRTKNPHRDQRKVQFKIDGHYYKFNFIQSNRNIYDRFNPVWLVKSAPGGTPNYTYQIVKNSDQFINGHFYIDNDKKAVVYAHYDAINKKILYDGMYGEGNETHIIKSLEHIRNPRLRSLNGDHLITKIDENKNPVLLHSSSTTRMNSQLWIETLENPLTIFYPKVLAVVDNHLFRKLGGDIAATVQYVVTFWNAVDRKYIELDSPKVQFILTGIIVAEDETALNYVYQSRYTPEDIGEDESDKADADLMKENARLYFHHNFSSDIKDFENYDATVILTGLNTFPVGGVTNLAKICDDWYNVAVIADDGQFGGVRSAIHEMAHLMNVQHDSLSEDDECYALPADGSVSMMSPYQMESNRVYWSDCSKKYFNDFSKLKAAQCLEVRQRTRYYPDD